MLLFLRSETACLSHSLFRFPVPTVVNSDFTLTNPYSERLPSLQELYA